MATRAPNLLVCAAGSHHYATPAQVARWKKADQERLDRETREKVQAHDDYLAGMRLFRERARLSVDGIRARGMLDAKQEAFQKGYDEAIRDLDRAFLDAVAARHAEEREV